MPVPDGVCMKPHILPVLAVLVLSGFSVSFETIQPTFQTGNFMANVDVGIPQILSQRMSSTGNFMANVNIIQPQSLMQQGNFQAMVDVQRPQIQEPGDFRANVNIMRPQPQEPGDFRANVNIMRPQIQEPGDFRANVNIMRPQIQEQPQESLDLRFSLNINQPDMRQADFDIELPRFQVFTPQIIEPQPTEQREDEFRPHVRYMFLDP